MHSRRVVAAVLAVGLSTALAGCSDDTEPTLAPPLETAAPPPTGYDPELEPARAVLALVPAEATTLEVTDLEQVRLGLGVVDLTAESPPAERAAFWRRASAEAPLLSDGLLRPAEAQLAPYGLSEADVLWEAQFSGGAEGWVIGLREDLPLDGVQRAVGAGVGPLAGAEVDAENRLVLQGAAADVAGSWAAEPDLAALVGEGTAQSTYVTRECVSGAATGDVGDLTDLGPFSVAFGGSLVTVRLGEGRADAFARADLAGDADFTRAYTDVVADPGTGRIGYALADPALAADLVEAGRLPFAACVDAG